jgi:hypothetical protein
MNRCLPGVLVQLREDLQITVTTVNLSPHNQEENYDGNVRLSYSVGTTTPPLFLANIIDWLALA